MKTLSALLAAMVLAGTGASAATQEYNIRVPLSIKNVPTIAPGDMLLTVSCAIGPSSISYSTATGDAQGYVGKGQSKTTLKGQMNSDKKTANYAGDATVVVTDPAGGGNPGTGQGGSRNAASNYLCWAHIDRFPGNDEPVTPVNFVSGLLK